MPSRTVPVKKAIEIKQIIPSNTVTSQSVKTGDVKVVIPFTTESNSLGETDSHVSILYFNPSQVSHYFLCNF